MKNNLKLAIDKFTVVQLTNNNRSANKTDTITQTSIGTSSLPCITIDITR